MQLSVLELSWYYHDSSTVAWVKKMPMFGTFFYWSSIVLSRSFSYCWTDWHNLSWELMIRTKNYQIEIILCCRLCEEYENYFMVIISAKFTLFWNVSEFTNESIMKIKQRKTLNENWMNKMIIFQTKSCCFTHHV